MTGEARHQSCWRKAPRGHGALRRQSDFIPCPHGESAFTTPHQESFTLCVLPQRRSPWSAVGRWWAPGWAPEPGSPSPRHPCGCGRALCLLTSSPGAAAPSPFRTWGARGTAGSFAAGCWPCGSAGESLMQARRELAPLATSTTSFISSPLGRESHGVNTWDVLGNS